MKENPQTPARKKRSPMGGFVLLALAAVLALAMVERFRDVPSAVAWGHELPAAFAAAKEQDKPVLIDFSASWCTYCKQMERDVIPQEAVLAEISMFVPVKIDVDADPESATRYGVDGLPTYVVTHADGTPVGAISGFQNASDFTWFLQRAREKAAQADQ